MEIITHITTPFYMNAVDFDVLGFSVDRQVRYKVDGVHLCGWWGEKKDHDEMLGCQLDELSALIPTAEEFGVNICVENMPLGIATSEYIKEVVEKANHKHVKACLDTGHANMQKEDILATCLIFLSQAFRLLFCLTW